MFLRILVLNEEWCTDPITITNTQEWCTDPITNTQEWCTDPSTNTIPFRILQLLCWWLFVRQRYPNDMCFVPWVFSFLLERTLEETMLPLADPRCAIISCFFFVMQFDNIALYCSSSSTVQFPSRIDASSFARGTRTLYGTLSFLTTVGRSSGNTSAASSSSSFVEYKLFLAVCCKDCQWSHRCLHLMSKLVLHTKKKSGSVQHRRN